MSKTDEVIREIPLDDHLHDSPFQPRKTHDQAELEEMAQTMRPPHGRVLQPIVVRPASAHTYQQHLSDRQLEIAFGHTRRLAAMLAGLTTIPAIVRAMTDEEVKRAQIVENLQRRGVNPVEEADAMKQLRDEHDSSIEDLMAQSGKKRSYIYNRLRLADAHDDVRAAVIGGRIDAEIAQEVARRPLPLQQRALMAVHGLSYRNAKAELDRSFQFKLASAPFDVLSIKLLPEAGACDACLKRSDREPVLLDECGPDVCMDGICYGKKATIAREIREREAREKAAAAAPPPPPPAAAEKPKTWRFGQQANIDQAADAGAGDGDGDDADESAHDVAARHSRNRYADLPPRERAVSDPEFWHRVKLAIFAKVPGTPRTTEDLRLLAHREIELSGHIDAPVLTAMGWDAELDTAPDQDELVRHKIATASPDQLAALLVLIGIEDLDGPHAKQELADRYDVDVIEASGVPIVQDEAQRDLVAEAGGDAPPPKKAKPAAKYRDPLTHQTWSGKGLKPKWLQVALESGRQLSEFTL